MPSLTIDIGGLLAAGRPIVLDEPVEVTAFGGFTFSQPTRAQLELRRVDHGIEVDGTIEATVSGPCDRCLEDITVPVSFPVEERFDPPSGTSDPFADNNVLTGDLLDVGDLVRQLVTSALPLGFYCSDNCLGLCPTCGRNKNDGNCTCPSTTEGDHGES